MHAHLCVSAPDRLLRGSEHLRIELSVPIEEDVTIAARFWECLAQLLDDPFCGGMWCYVAVQNLASLVLDDKEAIQHSERYRRHGEEIEGSDPLAVILEKGEPLPAGITTPNYTTQISGHRAFREGKAQLLQFRANLGSAPVGIVLGPGVPSNPSVPG